MKNIPSELWQLLISASTKWEGGVFVKDTLVPYYMLERCHRQRVSCVKGKYGSSLCLIDGLFQGCGLGWSGMTSAVVSTVETMKEYTTSLAGNVLIP